MNAGGNAATRVPSTRRATLRIGSDLQAIDAHVVANDKRLGFRLRPGHGCKPMDLHAIHVCPAGA
jgi:hypothetical protein